MTFEEARTITLGVPGIELLRKEIHADLESLEGRMEVMTNSQEEDLRLVANWRACRHVVGVMDRQLKEAKRIMQDHDTLAGIKGVVNYP